jgi:hypothetical protein
MATGYEPNIEGAIAVLRDLMIANSFTMTRQPYEPNYRGLVDAVIDLKEGFPTFAPFEDVSENDALYMRTSDGQVGKASASNGLQENAQVVGFANADASASATVKVIVIGLKTMSGLDAGDLYFLSPSTAGGITLTPPSSAGQAVVRVGEASTTTQFAIRIEPPIKLS